MRTCMACPALFASAAPSSGAIAAGLTTASAASTIVYCASPPMPNVDHVATMASPGLKPVTLGPTASTTPQMSPPGMYGNAFGFLTSLASPAARVSAIARSCTLPDVIVGTEVASLAECEERCEPSYVALLEQHRADFDINGLFCSFVRPTGCPQAARALGSLRLVSAPDSMRYSDGDSEQACTRTSSLPLPPSLHSSSLGLGTLSATLSTSCEGPNA